MNEIVLNWLMKILTLKLLKLSYWVWRKSLFTLRPFRLNSSNDVILSIKSICLRRKNKIVIDVHQASYSFQKVRGRSPANNKPSIICTLSLWNFLSATIKRVMHETCCPLRLLWLAAVHLLVNASCWVIILTLWPIGLTIVGWTLPSQGLFLSLIGL